MTNNYIRSFIRERAPWYIDGITSLGQHIRREKNALGNGHAFFGTSDGIVFIRYLLNVLVVDLPSHLVENESSDRVALVFRAWTDRACIHSMLIPWDTFTCKYLLYGYWLVFFIYLTWILHLFFRILSNCPISFASSFRMRTWKLCSHSSTVFW